MHWDGVEGNWKQMKGNVKTKWGRLTDDDLTAINGKREQLKGKLQERYDSIAKDQDAKRWMTGSVHKLGELGATPDVAGPAVQPGLALPTSSALFWRGIWVLPPNLHDLDHCQRRNDHEYDQDQGRHGDLLQ